MLSRVFHHVQRNAIAYVALFFAVGGGGAGAAIAATAITSSSAIHACVDNRTGALYVAKRCTRAQRALSLNQRGPAGPSGVVAYAEVDGGGHVEAEKGMKITQTSIGLYSVAVTAPACKHANDEIPVITPVGFGAIPGSDGYDPPPGMTNVQPAVTYGGSIRGGFLVQAGYLQPDGTLVHTTQGFNILDVCGNYLP